MTNPHLPLYVFLFFPCHKAALLRPFFENAFSKLFGVLGEIPLTRRWRCAEIARADQVVYTPALLATSTKLVLQAGSDSPQARMGAALYVHMPCLQERNPALAPANPPNANSKIKSIHAEITLQRRAELWFRPDAAAFSIFEKGAVINSIKKSKSCKSAGPAPRRRFRTIKNEIPSTAPTEKYRERRR